MAKLKVTVLYVAEHEFAIRENGRWMADAIRRAVADADAELAEGLQFDPEADGVAIGAPDRPALEHVLRLSIDAGLLVPAVLERLHPDLDDVATETWDGTGQPETFDDYARPFSPDSVTDTTFTARFTTSSYRIGEAPTRDTEEMAEITRRAVAEQGWPDPVAVRTEHDMFIFVEAQTIDRLDQVARLIGLPGIAPDAEETFEWRRTYVPIEAPALADPPWEVAPGHWSASPFEARGTLSDVPDHGGFEATSEGLGTLAERLAATDQRRSETISIELLESEIMIAGPTADDVEWALTILGIRPSKEAP